MAVGATFTALGVVPLALIGYEAWDTLRAGQGASWMTRFRWPIRFFLGVAFWNLVGAGSCKPRPASSTGSDTPAARSSSSSR